MKSYQKILWLENRRRQTKLIEFRAAVLQYFNGTQYEWGSGGQREDLEAQQARSLINLMLREVDEIIDAASAGSTLLWTDAPIAGGRQSRIDLIHNIFLLSRRRIDPNLVLDSIDQAIGVYRASERVAFFRMINPFHYLWVGISFVASLPFRMLDFAGFDGARAEDSLLGRLLKLFAYFVTMIPPSILAALEILKELGLWDQAKLLLLG